MNKQLLIAGGGIGGLAAALAAARAGWRVRLFERAASFSEVGAGIQLGPNVVRVLRGWGLEPALAEVAAFPQRLRVRDALSGCDRGLLQLADRMPQRYGAPYLTVHRADLHALLLAAVQTQPGVALRLSAPLAHFTQNAQVVTAQIDNTPAGPGPAIEGDALVGADGLWSPVRAWLLHDGPPRLTGHLAYRALVPQHSLPVALRCQDVMVWLGPQLHVVQYPVRGGEWLNLVAFVEGRLPGSDAGAVPDALAHWDHGANTADLQAAMGHCCAPLQDLLQAVASWRLWAMADRPPIQNAEQQTQGRVALLGDAAHPMRPYLAQGAGMAIEDAEALGRNLHQVDAADITVPLALRRYALERWQRNARVQARSLRNGRIFHATGFVRYGRDLAMQLLGERLLDIPWLYGGR